MESVQQEIQKAMEDLKMLAQSDMEREIYEGRLKARRDERAKMSGALEQGLQQGLQQGVEKGMLVGSIQMCQELLGAEGTSRAELESMDLETLQRIADELRPQLRR